MQTGGQINYTPGPMRPLRYRCSWLHPGEDGVSGARAMRVAIAWSRRRSAAAAVNRVDTRASCPAWCARRAWERRWRRTPGRGGGQRRWRAPPRRARRSRRSSGAYGCRPRAGPALGRRACGTARPAAPARRRRPGSLPPDRGLRRHSGRTGWRTRHRSRRRRSR